MQRRLTHLLFAFLLLCTQALNTGHAIEHAIDEGQGAPTHVCELCLAAHDLGNVLPGSVAALLLTIATFVLFSASLTGRTCLPALRARQQAPPSL
jgi:hypothetical protein